MLTPGRPAPAISSTNQHREKATLRTYRGHRVLVTSTPVTLLEALEAAK